MAESTDALWEQVETGIHRATGDIVNEVTKDGRAALSALAQLRERYKGECVWRRVGNFWEAACGHRKLWDVLGLEPHCCFCGKRIREAEDAETHIASPEDAA